MSVYVYVSVYVSVSLCECLVVCVCVCVCVFIPICAYYLYGLPSQPPFKRFAPFTRRHVSQPKRSGAEAGDCVFLYICACVCVC